MRGSAGGASRLTKVMGEWLWSTLVVPKTYRGPDANRGQPGWTMDQVIAAMWDDPVAIDVVRKLVAWAGERRLYVFGTTTKAPALAWHVDARGIDYRLFLADSRLAKSQESKLWIPMHNLKKKPVLADPARRAALIEALSVCFEIPRERADKEPSILLSELADGYAFHVFTSAWEAVIDDIRRGSGNRRQPE